MRLLPLSSTLACAAMLVASHAGANEYSAPLKANKYPDVERLANAALAREPGNADALIAKSEALLNSWPARVEAAVALGEQCVAANPRVSGCHLAYGNALGTKAIDAGIMSAIGYAGKIREAFITALELDPQNIEARFSLLQYYMQAPAIVGGGIGKARTLAGQSTAINAEAGTLMAAMLDIEDGKLAKAEAAVLAVKPGALDAVAEVQRDQLTRLAGIYLRDKKLADSERLYREVSIRFPVHPWGHFGLARVWQEQGRTREALAGFEKVMLLAPRPNVQYRIAQCQQALGERARARATYEAVLAAPVGVHPNMRKDVEDQLQILKK